MMRALRKRYYSTKFSSLVLALIFAALGFFAHTFEIWLPSLEAKAGQVLPVTVRLPARYFRITLLRNEFHYLSTTSSSCPHLVSRGTKLKRGGECSGLVRAYEKSRRAASPLHLSGIFLFYFLIGTMLGAFMRHRSMGRARLLRTQATVLGLLAISLIASKAILLFTALPAVVLPVVTVPIICANLFKRPLAFILAIVTALLTCALVNFDVEVFLVFLLSGIAAAVSQKDRYRAWTRFKGGAVASWAAVFSILITTLIFSGTLDIYDDLSEHFDPRYSLWIAALIGGLCSGVGAWLFTPAVGALVGEVSRSRLLDLQDLNQRILKQLRERAPGTWEHSRAMANLGEAAANAIGGNALLARVGAYYHDFGKSVHPEYFIENQAGGPNPHDELEPIESASRIFRHVTDGTNLLRSEGVSEDIVEFAYSHHGTSLLEYFWYKVMAAGNLDELSERDFSYPGHKPTTRETGIIMMVDAIEAAARTVDLPEKTAFQNLVQQIVFSKLSQGQLDESGLSLADLRVVVNTIVDALVNMYHARIKYPWQQTGDTGKTTTAEIEQPTEPVKEQEIPVAQTDGTQPESPAAPELIRTPIPAEQTTPTPIPVEAPFPVPTPVSQPSASPVPAEQPSPIPIPAEQPSPAPIPVVAPPKTSQTTTKPPEPVTKNPTPAVPVIAPVTPNSPPKPTDPNAVPIVPIRKVDSSQSNSQLPESGTPGRRQDGRMTAPMATPESEKKEK
ncbi:MAG: HDIG domain-containing protein [Proteobacteria bacterium]|nr:HDIG domain-containing protein [Pseudomonadota bacterium]